MKLVIPEIEKTDDQTVAKRRGFLLGATLGTAGVVAAVVVGKPAVETVAAVAKAEVKQSGYRLTPHIEHYYRTTEM
jgi:hypothetical protein